jgi:hypothetical protein
MRLRDLYRDRAAGLYVLLTAVFFHRPLTTQTFFFRDVYNFYYPRKVLLGAALRAGTFPLWDPLTSGGQPYLATPTYMAFYPANVLYAILPPVVAFNWILVLHYLLDAVFAYWLGRVVKLSQVAAFVVGIAYAFAGVTLSCASLGGWPLALPWIPLALGLTHRALRDGRSFVPAALAASMPLFASMPETAALLFLLIVIWALALRDVPRRRRVAGIAIVIGGAVGLSLIATLPATATMAQSSRGETRRSWESFTQWSVHPRRMPELIVPQYFGPTDTLDDRDYWGREWESKGFPLVLSIYFGAPLLLLAAFGAMRCPSSDIPRRTLAALALLAIALSLGRYLPGFRLIYDYIPLVTIFRFPVKMLVLALLPIALLAGCAAERVSSDRRSALLIAAVVTIDLLVAGYRVNAFAPRSIFDEPPLAAMVREAIGPLRLFSAPAPILINAPTNEVRWLAQSQIGRLNEQTAVMFGIPVVFNTDYDLLAPTAMARFTGAARELPIARTKPLLDAAGVRAILTPEVLTMPGVIEIARTERLHLYLNQAAYAARFAGPCAGGRARIIRRELNSARYEVDAPCDGRVIFSETHYDGWRAFVDGREVPHIRVLAAFTSVAVRRGHHVIERRYFPPRFAAGMIGSLLSMIALLVAQKLSRRA